MEIKVTLLDGHFDFFPQGTNLLEIAKKMKNERAKEILVAKVNGRVRDLNSSLEEDALLEFLTFEERVGKLAYWHTSSHILAQAVKHLFPGTKLGIGPAIENGFYYDFDSSATFTPDDLPLIEAEMRRLIEADIPLTREIVSKEKAKEIFSKLGETYKLELLEDLTEAEEISIYRQGDFVDLCAGPHLPSTGYVKVVKLLSIAGAYWRGDEHNKMLQRIYGVSFPEQNMLDEYLAKIEEAQRRDHRKLGVELGIFSLKEEGPGFPFFHPKGLAIRNELESFWRKLHRRYGYQEIRTPLILNRSLWERSGHWDHYKENMYFTTIDEEEYAIKPMNCPGAMLVYGSEQHSYRELPLRLAELGLVHRHELSGVLHGLLRVRAFTQDDAHIFMRPDQFVEEVKNVIKLTDMVYQTFGFDYRLELSTKPENAMGDDAVWEEAIAGLKQAAEEANLDYTINEGEGAFYGPKLDFHLRDSLGRSWQCGTIQADFQMADKFDLSYIGEDGAKHRPVIIHRVIFGSIERFIGILIEHYAGAFPLWLAPVQVKILPIADRHLSYASKIKDKLEERDFRVEIDSRNEKIGYKIRNAQVEQIPYMLVVGDKEAKEGLVALRHRRQGDLGTFNLENLFKMLEEERLSFEYK